MALGHRSYDNDGLLKKIVRQIGLKIYIYIDIYIYNVCIHIYMRGDHKYVNKMCICTYIYIYVCAYIYI